jgi:hypothetical protein
VSPAPGANGIKQLESGALRYSKGDKFTYDEIDGFGGEAHFANGKMTFMTGTAWIDPQTMLIVRHDLLFRSGGKIGENSSTQLVGIQRAPHLAP